MEKKSTVAMPSDLHSKNLNTVLNTICRKREFTVADIAASTKISRQTVAKALEELISLRLVTPIGKGSSTDIGGKKPMQYALNSHAYIICTTMCAHKTGLSLMTADYRRVDELDLPYMRDYQTVDQFVSACTVGIRTLLSRNSISDSDLLGVSLCFGGIIDEDGGLIRYSSTMPTWGRNIEIRRMVREALGNTVRISVDNVSRVCARAMISTRNINQRRIIVFYCDYGLGVTQVEEGQIHPSSHKVANEWGHMVLDPWDTEQCGCGGYGCLERLIGEERVLQKINALPPARRLILMDDCDPETDVRSHILKKSEQGNPEAKAIMMYMAEIFGIAIRNIYLAVDPDYLVFQGTFAQSSEEFLEALRRKACENRYLGDVNIDIRRFPMPLKELQEIGGVNTMLRLIVNEGNQ